MEWLTLEEASHYEKVSYDFIKKKYQRGGFLNTKTEPSESGGKDRVYIELSCLSDAASARYKSRQNYIKNCKPKIQARRAEDYIPWYYDADFDEYQFKYPEKVSKAIKRAEILDEYLEEKKNHAGEISSFTEQFAQERLGKSAATLYQSLQRYEQARKLANICLEETGFDPWRDFRILSLCPETQQGNGTVITEQMEKIILKIWSSEIYQRHNMSKMFLHEVFREECEKLGIEHVPSYRTIFRYVKKIEAHNRDVQAYLKGGERGFKNTAMLKGRRDMSQLQVMELVMADAHTFDCWVSFIDENGEINAVRPYLSAFIDARSRYLVGYGICIQPNAEVLKEILINMGERIGSVPKYLYIDNGKDYTAETLTGRSRTERFSFDSDINGFYRQFGIVSDKRALPYQPWSKGQVERVFGTICNQFSKRFKSYTGTLTGSKTDAKVDKDIKGMLLKGELPSIGEFAVLFEDYVEQYHNRQHSGLQEQKEPTPTPQAVFDNAPRYLRAAPPLEYSTSLLGQTEIRTVHNDGISLNGNKYIHEDLGGFIGEKVTVRFHKSHADSITVYAQDGGRICEAYLSESLSPIADADDEQLTEHIKMQKRQRRAITDSISRMQSGYKEPGIVMPELPEEKRKVIALPKDKEYNANIRRENAAERQKTEKRGKLNAFMLERAEKALKDIEEVENAKKYKTM